MEDQVSEAKLDIFLGELDMIVRVSRDAGQFLDTSDTNDTTDTNFLRYSTYASDRRLCIESPVRVSDSQLSPKSWLT